MELTFPRSVKLSWPLRRASARLLEGNRYAVDYGDVRIGLAVSDKSGLLASPVSTFQTSDGLDKLVEALVDPRVIYVGLPLNLQGLATPATNKAVAFARKLQSESGQQVYLLDERLTTALSNAQLRQIGKSQKQARTFVDQMAAVAILEYGLEFERRHNKFAGVNVAEWIVEND